MLVWPSGFGLTVASIQLFECVGLQIASVGRQFKVVEVKFTSEELQLLIT
jgi:hypothetical protein